MALATIREAGEVPVAQDHGEPAHTYHFALVLTFDNPEDLRSALAAGAVTFDWPGSREHNGD